MPLHSYFPLSQNAFAQLFPLVTHCPYAVISLCHKMLLHSYIPLSQTALTQLFPPHCVVLRDDTV